MDESKDLCCMVNPVARCYYCSKKACADCCDKAMKTVPLGGNTLYDILARACTARQEHIDKDGHSWHYYKPGIL